MADDTCTGGKDRSLHEQYEPEEPIHRAVNISSRRLKDRIELIEHDEFSLWKAEDPNTARKSDHWYDTPGRAVDFLASSVNNEICCVNECMVHLGEDAGRIICDDHHPDDYIECAEADCDLPTKHTETDYCSSHTWWNGRSVDADSEQPEVRTDD